MRSARNTAGGTLGALFTPGLIFNKLFSIQPPLQMLEGMLLFLGINTLIYFNIYKKSLVDK
jgi:hypothetical protein